MEARMECTGAGDCTASPHLHGCYADRGDCDRPGEHAVYDTRRPLAAAIRDCSSAAEDIWAGDRQRRAEKALDSELESGHPLWKPWALDLADDVTTLLGTQERLERELERACRIAAWALEVVVDECGGTFEEALAEAEREIAESKP